jgi:hypothetical protein
MTNRLLFGSSIYKIVTASQNNFFLFQILDVQHSNRFSTVSY